MELAIQTRDVFGKKTKYLRAIDVIPGVVYGHTIEKSDQITFPKQAFLKLYKQAGYSTPINLVDGKKHYYVLIHDIQLDPVTDRLMHVDFLSIDKNQKVTTEVNLVFTGTAPVEKLGFKVQQIKDTLEIEALPADLPHEITVDLSVLEQANDVIFVKDLTLPKGVVAKEEGDTPIVTVVEIEDEVEEAPIASVADAAAAAAPAAPATK